MKRVLVVAAFAVLAILGASSADAQICVNFDAFCDCLELNVDSGSITGEWQNWDCLGATAPVTGNVGGGNAKVFCTDDAQCPSPSTCGSSTPTATRCSSRTTRRGR